MTETQAQSRTPRCGMTSAAGANPAKTIRSAAIRIDHLARPHRRLTQGSPAGMMTYRAGMDRRGTAADGFRQGLTDCAALNSRRPRAGPEANTPDVRRLVRERR